MPDYPGSVMESRLVVRKSSADEMRVYLSGETSQNRMREKAITSFRPLMNSDRFLHRESDS